MHLCERPTLPGPIWRRLGEIDRPPLSEGGIKFPGITLVAYVEQFKVNDTTPLEAEAEAAVCRLRPFRAGVHTHLRAVHFKQWMWEAYPGVDSKSPTLTK